LPLCSGRPGFAHRLKEQFVSFAYSDFASSQLVGDGVALRKASMAALGSCPFQFKSFALNFDGGEER